jgi:DNA uptake protein ComE-like DNA-binding protein
MSDDIDRDPRRSVAAWTEPCEGKSPTWLLLTLGWVFATTSLRWASPSPHLEGQTNPIVDLESSSARDFRRLPGIGPSRAAGIVDLRWRRGRQGFSLEEVRGIGPRTQARALAANGKSPP